MKVLMEQVRLYVVGQIVIEDASAQEVEQLLQRLYASPLKVPPPEEAFPPDAPPLDAQRARPLHVVAEEPKPAPAKSEIDQATADANNAEVKRAVQEERARAAAPPAQAELLPPPAAPLSETAKLDAEPPAGAEANGQPIDLDVVKSKKRVSDVVRYLVHDVGIKDVAQLIKVCNDLSPEVKTLSRVPELEQRVRELFTTAGV